MRTTFNPEILPLPVTAPISKQDRAIKVMKFGTLISMPISIFWSVLGYISGNSYVAGLNAMFFIASLAVLSILKLNAPELAKHVFLTAALVFVGLMTLCVTGSFGGYGGATQFYLFAVAVAVFYIFDQGKWVPKALYLLVCVGSFFLLEYSSISQSPIAPLSGEETILAQITIFSAIFALLIFVGHVFTLDVANSERALALANARVESLLENMLPKQIADRLREEGKTFADGFEECTILFADIVGFTKLSQSTTPNELVAVLSSLFSEYDEIAEELGVEKIKTIGDAYMVACGIPTPNSDHAKIIAEFAISIQKVTAEFEDLDVRIGINSGPVVAGVIGKRRFIYDLWGDAVNVASRMESHGMPGEIQVSRSTYDLLTPHFEFEARGLIEIKGKGELEAFLLRKAR